MHSMIYTVLQVGSILHDTTLTVNPLRPGTSFITV